MKLFWSSRAVLANQKGQTIVEYILLAVVALTIAYGLAKNFFTPLKNYGASVFSNTIACALQYGQLPSQIVTEDGCEASIKGVGRLDVVGGGGGSGGGGGGGSGGGNQGGSGGRDGRGSRDRQGSQDKQDGSNQKENSSQADANQTQESTPGSSSASRSNRGGRGGAIVNSKGEFLKLGPPVGASERQRRSEAVVINPSELGGGAGSDYELERRRSRGRRSVLRPLSEDFASELLKRSKKDRQTESVVGRSVAGTEGEDVKKNRKIEVNTNRDKKQSDEQEQTWDMAKILRIGLVVLMIIAILVFVFFQVSQIRKNSGAT